MPVHHMVRLAGRLEHVVRRSYFLEVAVFIPLFEDDFNSPVRGTLRVWEVPLTAKLAAPHEREDEGIDWLRHKSKI